MTRSMIGAILLCGLTAGPAMAWADEDPDDRASAIQEAMELPEVTQQLRETGVDEDQISESLETLREGAGDEAEDAEADPDDEAADRADEMAAGRAARVLGAEAETAREHGPMEDLGEFLQQQLDEGVRGQDLADSIRERRDNRTGPPEDVGRDDRGAPGEAGQRPDEAGQRAPDEAGQRPDEAGDGQPAGQRPDKAGEADDDSADRRDRGEDAAQRRGRPDQGDDAEDEEDGRPGRDGQRGGGR